MKKNGSKSELRRLRIIEAAARAFADSGFHQTRTADIARKAGVGEGTIFNYFKDKNNLLFRVVEKISSDVDACVESLADSGMGACERFLVEAEKIEAYFYANPWAAELIVRELRHRDVREFCRVFFEHHCRKTESVFDEMAVEAGFSMDEEESRALAVAYIGGIDLIFVRWCDSGKSSTFDPGLKRFSEIFLSLFRGMGKREGSR